MQVRGQREYVHFYGHAGRAIKMKFFIYNFFPPYTSYAIFKNDEAFGGRVECNLLKTR